jgi:hypothetical protein
MVSNMLQIDCDDNPVSDEFPARTRGFPDIEKFEQQAISY